MAVPDERLPSIDDVVVSVASSGRRHAQHMTAGLRFGDRYCRQASSGADGWQPTVFLALATEMQDLGDAQL